jgi:hypothetical protein
MWSYKDQYQRVLRYLARIENRNRDRLEYEDDLLSFFQNCWHLKDWIKKDNSVPEAVREGLETELEQHKALKISQDIATKAKHLVSYTSHSGEQLSGGRAWQIGPEGTTFDYQICLLDGTPSGLALDVAREAVRDWEDILRANGLPTPDP